MLALVDDDAALRHALVFELETAGYRVAAFADAETALLAEEQERWRFLILDLRLPGMSGLDLLEHLRARSFAAPAVLITTHPSRATRERARLAGVSIVEKPLLGDQLVQVVTEIYSGPEPYLG